MRGLPDFLIIGASRCGTTSLHMYLGEHPYTLPPNGRKELSFFNLVYEDDKIPAYVDCWPKNFNQAIKRYESTTDYLFEPQVPERVKFWMPECKFIVLLRNPVNRAWSEYYMYWMVSFRVPIKAFIKAIDDVKYDTPEQYMHPYTNESYYRSLQKGIYHKCLTRWFKYFDKRRFLILKSEDFFAEPQKAVDLCCRHLDLAKFELTDTTIHDPFKPQHITYPSCPKDIEKKLYKFYKPFNEMLYKLLDKGFEWENNNAD
ncbi:MAG: sulfotransferase domain-containing protein [Candidatus Hodarchaeota archaeon]